MLHLKRHLNRKKGKNSVSVLNTQHTSSNPVYTHLAQVSTAPFTKNPTYWLRGERYRGGALYLSSLTAGGETGDASNLCRLTVAAAVNHPSAMFSIPGWWCITGRATPILGSPLWANMREECMSSTRKMWVTSEPGITSRSCGRNHRWGVSEFGDSGQGLGRDVLLGIPFIIAPLDLLLFLGDRSSCSIT